MLNKLKNRKVIYSLVCVLLIISIIVYLKHRNASDAALPVVTIKKLSLIVIPITVSAYGEVVSPNSVTLRAQANGTITSVNFTPGQTVKKGQLLFTLSSNNESSQLGQYSAELAMAKDKYERYLRLSKLYVGVVAKVQLMQFQTEYQQAQAQYNAAAAIHNITSPIDGVISDTSLTPGAFVNNGDMLAYIVSPSNLQLRYELPGEYSNQVALGQKVLFYPKGMQNAYSATVSYISPALNPEDYNITLRANLSAANLPANTFGSVVQILNPNHQALAIPQSLIQNDENGFFVYILDKQDKVTNQYCKLGNLTSSGLVVINSGLAPGMRLVTSNLDDLVEGEKVKGVVK